MFNSVDRVLEISDAKVMQSAAGFYIGRSCETEITYEDGVKQIITEPYDRHSGYYPTAEAAQKDLEAYV